MINLHFYTNHFIYGMIMMARGVTKNTMNGIKFIEFLASNEAQELYAKSNHEYPIREDVQVSSIVKSWGYPFKIDKIDLDKLGINNAIATKIFDQVNWQ